jgi:hypothetical protein
VASGPRCAPSALRSAGTTDSMAGSPLVAASGITIASKWQRHEPSRRTPCRKGRHSSEPIRSSARESAPPPRLGSSSAKRSTTFVRASTAHGQPNRRSQSGSAKPGGLASNSVLRPGVAQKQRPGEVRRLLCAQHAGAAVRHLRRVPAPFLPRCGANRTGRGRGARSRARRSRRPVGAVAPRGRRPPGKQS